MYIPMGIKEELMRLGVNSTWKGEVVWTSSGELDHCGGQTILISYVEGIRLPHWARGQDV